MKGTVQKTIAGLAIAGMLTGCANMNNMGLTDNQKTALGAAGGAILGGIVGHQVHDKNGRYVGAVVGALAGGAITNYMNQQQAALQQSPTLNNAGIDVSRIDNSTIKLNLPSAITFATNSANLNASVYSSLTEIVRVVNKYPQTIIHVSGFTDSDGSDAHNLELSKRRAQAVANYLASQGVNNSRIVARGYGEQYPVASNTSASGKAQNRRAEIHIKAIEQGNPQAAYTPVY